ncbi:hypothetical protein KX729_03845 [Rhizobium sp. XQZ8]|uniref:hypothetical protein n=1 Tax=Rhizobium populisoli TaxID=2859785 RepID=UPI001CA4F71B|nr:hypothetical protein [Rhizobium populisoli]MBW6420563.1 hypothetical protein [Rhizobium populisoli]
MFGLFSKKPKTKPMLVATLNARLQPLDRGEIEDAFDDTMKRLGLNIRVVGGGTLMTNEGEPEDIDIEVDDLSAEIAATVTRAFEAMLAPVGSRLRLPDQTVVEFGRQHGLGLYLNGTDLPRDIYTTCDSNHVYRECNRLLEGVGRVSSHWQGAQETALYMYGTDFSVMHDRLTTFLETYPLCQKCRVERIA